MGTEIKTEMIRTGGIGYNGGAHRVAANPEPPIKTDAGLQARLNDMDKLNGPIPVVPNRIICVA